MLIASLRDVIRNQSEEVEALQRKLKEATAANVKEVCSAGRPLPGRPLAMITLEPNNVTHTPLSPF